MIDDALGAGRRVLAPATTSCRLGSATNAACRLSAVDCRLSMDSNRRPLRPHRCQQREAICNCQRPAACCWPPESNSFRRFFILYRVARYNKVWRLQKRKSRVLSVALTSTNCSCSSQFNSRSSNNNDDDDDVVVTGCCCCCLRAEIYGFLFMLVNQKPKSPEPET